MVQLSTARLPNPAVCAIHTAQGRGLFPRPHTSRAPSSLPHRCCRPPTCTAPRLPAGPWPRRQRTHRHLGRRALTLQQMRIALTRSAPTAWITALAWGCKSVAEHKRARGPSPKAICHPSVCCLLKLCCQLSGIPGTPDDAGHSLQLLLRPVRPSFCKNFSAQVLKPLLLQLPRDNQSAAAQATQVWQPGEQCWPGATAIKRTARAMLQVW